jgi:hypothetical protein
LRPCSRRVGDLLLEEEVRDSGGDDKGDMLGDPVNKARPSGSRFRGQFIQGYANVQGLGPRPIGVTSGRRARRASMSKACASPSSEQAAFGLEGAESTSTDRLGLVARVL